MAKTVKAQMPGTFYRRPDPDSEFYVEEGAAVSAGDTVGLIEVMKSFHEPWTPDKTSWNWSSRQHPQGERVGGAA